MIHAEALAAVIGNIQHTIFNTQHSKLKSPGLLKKHYSPKAKLLVLSWCDDAELEFKIQNSKFKTQNCFIIAHTHIPAGKNVADVSVMPHDAEAFARALYAELHRCDAAGAELIVLEAPPDSPEWSGVADRLRRAAA
jgi:L-threonylcarbamoyladenylate synthase